MPRRGDRRERIGFNAHDGPARRDATKHRVFGTQWHLFRYQWLAWIILAVAWLVVALWLDSVLERVKRLEQGIEREQREWEIEHGD